MKVASRLFAILALAGISLGGISLGTILSSSGIVLAAPSSSVSVQDEGGSDGALIDADGTVGAMDSDGTQGDFRSAMEGDVSGPVMVATPQTTAQ